MLEQTNLNKVRIEPWADTDLTLLRCLNEPEMMKHLGGPESEGDFFRATRDTLRLVGKAVCSACTSSRA